MVEKQESVTDNNHSRRLTKNEKRRMKKKEANKNDEVDSNVDYSKTDKLDNSDQFDAEGVEVEYVAPELINDAGLDEEQFEEYKRIFNKLAFGNADSLIAVVGNKSESNESVEVSKNGHSHSEEAKTDENHDEVKKLSKRKKKLLTRLSVSELKQLVSRPDVVEAHDVTSSDPRLLVFLKAYRNTVPVPRHWCYIRKYLQGKRGIEKIPYQLPEFIAETGIAKIRDAVLEQEALKKSKQKARERTRPKMGKIDIDYQVLHDAFFKYQTKPKLSGPGDLYYEGKEFEVQLKEKKPGVLSPELIAALGMQEGAPPPWLINMQRYGPPPSYLHLRIPGLNAPLPPGASYGYQPGGWGKPPVDEYGRPLYGDVFGMAATAEVDNGPEVDRDFRWGNLETEELEETDEEDEEVEELEEFEDSSRGRSTKNGFESTGGLDTPSTLDGTSSMISGMETPDTIDIRKRAGLETPDISIQGQGNRELYQVVKERKASATGSGQLFGSDRLYVLPGKSDLQMSLNPDELDDLVKNKERLKEAHDAQIAQQDLMFKHMNYNRSNSNDGMETEQDRVKGSKKRKADQTTVLRKMKEFKF